MEQVFLCLANSYKYKNRCIVGVEIIYNPELNTYYIIKDTNDNPVWFRPISPNTEAGAIPNEEARKISIFDVVKAHHIERIPNGAQSENHYYDSLEIIGKIPLTTKALDILVDKTHHSLFGNRGIAVHPDKYYELDYSVLLIKCTEVEFYLKDRVEMNPQPRAKFCFFDNEYDLPVTDPSFRQIIVNNLQKANSYSYYYFTITLGLENEGWHSKLIACVLPIPQEMSTIDVVLPSKKAPSTVSDDTRTKTFTLFKQGFTIEEIAQKRNMVADTISNHLVHFIETGEINVRQLVDDNKILRVSEYKRKHPEETKLKPFFEAFNEEISFSELKWILAALNNGML